MAIGQKIVQAIKNRLHEYGFEGVPHAQSMCIGLAADVKKIMLAEARDTYITDQATSAADWTEIEERAKDLWPDACLATDWRNDATGLVDSTSDTTDDRLD